MASRLTELDVDSLTRLDAEGQTQVGATKR
jgi:hypothetical protein